MRLAHSVVGDGPRAALVMHGILGNGNNWKLFVRQLAAQRPEWRFILVDLRNHGDSRGLPPPHSLAACAADLEGLDFEVAIGHSFGGKVALQLLDRPVEQVWALDSNPGAGASVPGEVERVFAALKQVPQPLERRDQLVKILVGMGFSEAIAAWMTTNLRTEDGPVGSAVADPPARAPGLRWRFDLDACEEMLQDYFRVDAWPALEDPRVRVVVGGRSDRWSDADLRRLPQDRTFTLPKAGHWLHADDPEGLRALLAAGLP